LVVEELPEKCCWKIYNGRNESGNILADLTLSQLTLLGSESNLLGYQSTVDTAMATAKI